MIIIKYLIKMTKLNKEYGMSCIPPKCLTTELYWYSSIRQLILWPNWKEGFMCLMGSYWKIYFLPLKFGSILHTHIKMTEYVSNQSLVVLMVPLLQILVIGPFKTFVFSWQRYIKELFLYHFTISLPWRDLCIPKIIFTCPSTFCTYTFMFS